MVGGLVASDNVFHVHDSILSPRIYFVGDKENNKYFVLRDALRDGHYTE